MQLPRATNMDAEEAGPALMSAVPPRRRHQECNDCPTLHPKVWIGRRNANLLQGGSLGLDRDSASKHGSAAPSVDSRDVSRERSSYREGRMEDNITCFISRDHPAFVVLFSECSRAIGEQAS